MFDSFQIQELFNFIYREALKNQNLPKEMVLQKFSVMLAQSIREVIADTDDDRLRETITNITGALG